ncbi:hypothetical protein ACWDT6_08740 [Nocardia grenadensis]
MSVLEKGRAAGLTTRIAGCYLRDVLRRTAPTELTEDRPHPSC